MTLLSSGLVIAEELAVSQSIPDFNNLNVGESVDMSQYIINPAGVPITTKVLNRDPAILSYAGTTLTAIGPGTNANATLQVSTSTWATQGSVANLPAFPGLRGHGYDSYHGSGREPSQGSTTVYYVTNTNTTGTGSLRAALEASGPRVIVPATSGLIDLGSQGQITISNPYCYFAGQCAPSPGLHVAGSIRVATHNVLLHHLSVFNNGLAGQQTNAEKCLQLGGTGVNVYQAILANCGALWAMDEGITVIQNSRTYDWTVWQSISAEHLDGDGSGYGTAWIAAGRNWTTGQTGAPGNGAGLRNFFAHNKRRNPRTDGGQIEVANNLLYDCQFGIEIGAYNNGGGPDMQQNTRGNGGVRGPSYTPDELVLYLNFDGWDNDIAVESFNHDGNVISSDYGVSLVDNRPGQAISSTVMSGPSPEGFVVTDVVDSDAGLLDMANLMDSTVGPRPADRIAVYQNLIDRCINRLDGTGDTSSHKQTTRPSNPTIATNTIDHETTGSHGVGVIPTTGKDVVQGSGYTLLEEWLHEHNDWAMGNTVWRT